jgi:hypothetical protein
VRCCFHEDRLPSLSLNMEKGVWNCHAGCGSGGILAFEMKFSSCDESAAKGNISDLLDDNRLFQQGQKPEAIYKYQEADGRLAVF